DAGLSQTKAGFVDGSGCSSEERESLSHGKAARRRVRRVRYGEDTVWGGQRGPWRFCHLFFNRRQLFCQRRSYRSRGGRFSPTTPGLPQEPWHRRDWIGTEIRLDLSMERRVHASVERGAHARYETQRV